MIKKIGLLLAGAMGLLVLEACVFVEVDCAKTPTDPSCSSSGGAGGGGGEGTGGKTVSSSSSSSGGGMAGAGGAPPCAMSCLEVASDNTLTPCAGTDAEKEWNTLSECTCKTAGAMGCADVCADNRCMGMTSSAECDTCISAGACSEALKNCN